MSDPPDVPSAPDSAPAGSDVSDNQGGSQSPTPPEGGDSTVDIASLPAEAQAYIKELREESRDRRKAYEPYKDAFSEYNDSEKDYLLSMVTTLSTDQEAGANTMLELANRMLGVETAAEEAVAPEAIEEAKEAGMSEQDYRELVREEVNNERLVLEVKAETQELGIDPDSEEAYKLWDLATRLDMDDLTKVLPIYNQMNGITPEVASAAAPEFPKTAAVPASTGGANAEDRQAPPKVGSPEMRERVRARIEAANTPG